MPTIPIQIPQRESFTSKAAKMISLQDAIEGRRQNLAAQDIFRNTTDPAQIQSQLQREGLMKPAMDYAEHLARMDTEQLQQGRLRLQALDAAIPRFKQIAQGIIRTIDADEATAQKIIPESRQAIMNIAGQFGLPPGVIVPPENASKEEWQRFLHEDLESIDEHNKHTKEEFDAEEARRKSEYERKAHVAAQTKAAMEKVTFREGREKVATEQKYGTVDAKGFVDDWLAAKYNTTFDAATPTQRTEARQAHAQRAQQPLKPTFQEQTFQDFLNDPKLTSKYGANRVGFEQWQSDMISQRQQTNFNFQQGVTNPRTQLPAEYKTALDRAMLSVPANRRRYVTELANNIYASGDETELKEVIRQTAIEGEDVNTRRAITGRVDAISALNDMQRILTELKAAGVDTNILTGTAEDIARRLGISKDPRLVEFGTRAARALNTYTLAMSGVQFSVREAEMYERMFPNYRQTMPVNEATIRGMVGAMQLEDSNYWERKLGKEGSALVLDRGNGSGGATLDAEILRAIEDTQ